MCSAVRKNLIAATAAASLVGSFVMGAAANLPLALAPGMGLNAYFTCVTLLLPCADTERIQNTLC